MLKDTNIKQIIPFIKHNGVKIYPVDKNNNKMPAIDYFALLKDGSIHPIYINLGANKVEFIEDMIEFGGALLHLSE